ncbi:MAG: tRNA epoxyqueuosine(34) reductase QueG [Bacteroidia bacterium]|nr:tRNA epoxyqueuosine(34) reductase QueG [Bacteroidia bacterium]
MSTSNASLIRQEAHRLGFSQCGFSKATFLEEEAPRLEAWLGAGMQGQMQYMENYFDKRLDPRLLVPDAETVISLTLNYYPSKKQNADAPKISKYAYGTDYHFVIKDKLKQLLAFIQLKVGAVQGRAFVDSAPVLDRAWAKRSGLGWIGKNANLINPKQGSFFFLAELIIDLKIEPDVRIQNYCGTCTRCIDACPTQAIIKPSVVDGSKCISYFTIELKDAIPYSYKNQFENWAFGCDVCQDVCPWNRFSKPHNETALQATETLLEMSANDWQEITEDVFKKLFKNSAVKRTGFKGLIRNLAFIKPSS